jgi:flavin reductase (DIM6/NTAB) family NADH-FMN oxidoreductase RutF
VVDQKLLREVTGRFATGVAVVSTRHHGDIHGMTVNSFCSVSLSPPLVLFCGTATSRTAQLIAQSRIFAVNILAFEQRDLSSRFAGAEAEELDRFTAIPTTTAVTGAPVLTNCLAWLDCTLDAVYPGGDHDIFVGRVQALSLQDLVPPLVFHASRYHGLAAHAPEAGPPLDTGL